MKSNRSKQRAKRRRARHRIVIMQKFFIAFLICLFIGGGVVIVLNIPSIKLNREISAGQEYTAKESYGEAIESYENALKIDSTSVNQCQTDIIRRLGEYA